MKPEMDSDTQAVPGRRGLSRGAKWAIALAVLLGLASMAGAGIAYAGYNYSHRYEGRILPGAKIAHVAVGGLTRHEALHLVRAAVKPALTRPIHVTWHGKSWRVTPKQLGAHSNARAAVNAAMAASARQSFVDKLQMRVFGHGLGFHRGVAITYPHQGVRGFVHGLSSGFDVDAVDASLDYSTGWVKILPDQTGRKVLVRATRHRIMHALRIGKPHVKLAEKTVEPAVTTDAFQKVLLVRIGENKLYLYENGQITHSWTVATGQPLYPTPQGQFVIVSKRNRPNWVNPQPNGWGSSMPASIPPGPNNPMGLRELNWSAAGVAFHGVPTSELPSLGYNASHGCIRMSNKDSLELFGLVDVGTPFVSIQVAPYKPMV